MTESHRPSAYVARLPVGTRLPLGDLAHDELMPFEGDVQVKPLQPPVLPEPPRRGEPGGEPCWMCEHPDANVIWNDDHWRVRTFDKPSGLPLVAMLEPVAHADLDDLPIELAAEWGVRIQRVAAAIGTLDGIGRVHVNRWGDGSQHLHLWFLTRPAGMWQLRGACLALWDDFLPAVPEGEWQENRRRVAAALAAGGGVARV